MISNRLLPATALVLLATWASAFADTLDVPASHPSIRWEGRVSGPDSGAREASFPTTRAVLRFRGSSAHAWIDSGRTWWNVSVDGGPTVPLRGLIPSGWRKLAGPLPEGDHEVVLSKRTEPMVERARVRAFRAIGSAAAFLEPPPENPFGIEFLGNSITCGYGLHGDDPDAGFLDSTEDADSTASAIAARTLGAEYRSVCYSGYGVVRDAVKGPGTIPGLYDKVHPNLGLAWDHARWHPRIVVINLGTNDFAKDVPDSAWFFDGYADFIRHIVAVHPGVSIALLNGPMLADGWPIDSLGNPVMGRSILRGHLVRLMEVLRPELGIAMDTIPLTLQTVEIGFGGDYHPNPVQSRLNGQELVAGLRRAFPGLLASVGAARAPAARSGNSWNGSGPWSLVVRDVRGTIRFRSQGTGPGSLRRLELPRGAGIAELRQDGVIRRWSVARF